MAILKPNSSSFCHMLCTGFEAETLLTFPPLTLGLIDEDGNPVPSSALTAPTPSTAPGSAGSSNNSSGNNTLNVCFTLTPLSAIGRQQQVTVTVPARTDTASGSSVISDSLLMVSQWQRVIDPGAVIEV